MAVKVSAGELRTFLRAVLSLPKSEWFSRNYGWLVQPVLDAEVPDPDDVKVALDAVALLNGDAVKEALPELEKVHPGLASILANLAEENVLLRALKGKPADGVSVVKSGSYYTVAPGEPADEVTRIVAEKAEFAWINDDLAVVLPPHDSTGSGPVRFLLEDVYYAAEDWVDNTFPEKRFVAPVINIASIRRVADEVAKEEKLREESAERRKGVILEIMKVASQAGMKTKVNDDGDVYTAEVKKRYGSVSVRAVVEFYLWSEFIAIELGAHRAPTRVYFSFKIRPGASRADRVLLATLVGALASADWFDDWIAWKVTDRGVVLAKYLLADDPEAFVIFKEGLRAVEDAAGARRSITADPDVAWERAVAATALIATGVDRARVAEALGDLAAKAGVGASVLGLNALGNVTVSDGVYVDGVRVADIVKRVLGSRAEILVNSARTGKGESEKAPA